MNQASCDKHHVLHVAIERQLGFAADLAVERVDRGVEIEEPEGIPHRRVSARHQGRIESGFAGEPRRDGRAGAVDDRIGQLRRDDLAPQAMPFDVAREALAHRGREITRELALEIGIVRHVARANMIVERQLGIGEQHRELGARQAFAAFRALLERLLAGQELDGAIEPALGLEHAHEALGEGDILGPAPLGERERERLQVIVAQHEAGDILGHLGKQRVALVHGQGVRREWRSPARS